MPDNTHRRELFRRVALRKESVDRNVDSIDYIIDYVNVALRKESVDRNVDSIDYIIDYVKSLSARRAWIEISAV